MSVEMKRCEKCGSFYNQAKDPVCPHCSGAQAESDKTMPVTQGVTVPMTGGRATSVPYGGTVDDGRTLPVFRMETGIDPVVGWLVCVSGSEMGRDYKIHSDNNYMGRSEKMDICIRGDETISRENHATITYDGRERVFYFTPGESRSIVRLNGKAVMMTNEIKAYDKIELGITELMFIPVCGAAFDWSELRNKTQA